MKYTEREKVIWALKKDIDYSESQWVTPDVLPERENKEAISEEVLIEFDDGKGLIGYYHFYCKRWYSQGVINALTNNFKWRKYPKRTDI